MPITHFKIVSLPLAAFVTPEVDGVPLVIGQAYPIAQQNLLTFERIPIFSESTVVAQGQYQLLDLNETPVQSTNIANFTVQWTNSIAPISSNNTVVFTNNQSSNLLDLLSLELGSGVEFIEVVSVNTTKNLTNNIYSGQIIRLPELSENNLTIPSSGTGLPYFELEYKVGKELTTEATTYTKTVNVDPLGSASISILTGPTVNNDNVDIDVGGGIIVNYPRITETYKIQITGGLPSATANSSIIIASPFLSENAYSYVLIDGIEYDVNQTANIASSLDSNGNGVISIKNYIIDTTLTSPKIGNLNLTLDNINGNATYVDSGNNNIVLATSI